MFREFTCDTNLCHTGLPTRGEFDTFGIDDIVTGANFIGWDVLTWFDEKHRA